MTFSTIVALFGTMFVLAIIPGPSVFAVVARSMASGFAHGLVTTIGIVVGDFIFIFLAIFGLWTIAETMGSVFFLIKYIGSAYLIYLGIGIWMSKSKNKEIEGVKELSWVSNFLCGLFITLSDAKAIIFYVSFFPLYLDLSNISIIEIGVILLIVTVAVGGAKIAYAYLADKTRFLFKSSKIQKVMRILAASTMIGTGILLIVKN